MSSNIEVVAYKVKKGDCLWNIVKGAGFPAGDWKKIYDAPYNKSLKSKIQKEKRTPDTIYPGETVYLPAFNKADIQKKTNTVKEMRKSVERIQVALKTYEKLVSNVKNAKAAEKAKKTKALRDLKKKRDELDALIVEGAGKFKMGEQGDKGRIIFTRWYNRRSFGVHTMNDQIEVMLKNMDNSKFDSTLKELESQVKKTKKQLQETYVAIFESEKELEKMMKQPY